VVVDPNAPAAVEGELERCLEGGAHWAVKIHPSFHAYPSDGPVYRRVYDWVQRRGGVPDGDAGRPFEFVVSCRLPGEVGLAFTAHFIPESA
jgi:predicted TIM-barrel fold metal-dependent hydrolase